MARMTSADARAVFSRAKINPHVDFHALRSEQVEALLVAADAWKYRKPRGARANGVVYYGTYYKSAGNYARAKRRKSNA